MLASVPASLPGHAPRGTRLGSGSRRSKPEGLTPFMATGLPSQPAGTYLSVPSCHPTFSALVPHHSSPVHYVDLFCFSPSTGAQQVPINNFKWSPIFPEPQAIMEI